MTAEAPGGAPLGTPSGMSFIHHPLIPYDPNVVLYSKFQPGEPYASLEMPNHMIEGGSQLCYHADQALEGDLDTDRNETIDVEAIPRLTKR